MGGSTGTATAPVLDAASDATAAAVDTGSEAGTPGTGGWPNCTSIFDGKTFDGWGDGTSSWTIVDGAFRSKPTAPRGQIGTVKSYKDFRLIFSVRQIQHGDHNPCTLIWGRKLGGGDAFGGAYQFQAPTPFGWNYNGAGGDLGLKRIAGPDAILCDNNGTKNAPCPSKWYQCELLARATGTVRMACCVQDATGSQPCKAAEMIAPYTNTGAVFLGPVGFQIHSGNAGIVDEYKNICVEENPTSDDMITTK
jgi:hypothetical protein